MTAFHTHVFRTMGTDASVVLPDADRELTASVVDLFSDWDAALTRFSPESELSRLNAAAGQPFLASELLLTVADESLREPDHVVVEGRMVVGVAGRKRTFDNRLDDLDVNRNRAELKEPET